MTREEAIDILKRIVNTSNELTHPVILNTEMEAINVAIEALQAQVTLDDVSTAYENGYKQGKFEAQQWVPCSERLPKDDDWQIVTILDERGDTPYRYSDFGWYLNRAECWIIDAEQRTDVIAWIPLPSPYKGDKS